MLKQILGNVDMQLQNTPQTYCFYKGSWVVLIYSSRSRTIAPTNTKELLENAPLLRLRAPESALPAWEKGGGSLARGHGGTASQPSAKSLDFI